MKTDNPKKSKGINIFQAFCLIIPKLLCSGLNKFGGGEGDMKNATPLQRANWFDRFVAVKEVLRISKAELFKGYREERILPGWFTL